MWREAAIRRATFVFVLLGIGALAVVARLFQLQVAEHGYWTKLAREIQEEVIELPARRGTIYDRNGLPLARDVPAYDIALDNYHMTKPEVLVELLSRILNFREKEAVKVVYQEGYFTWVKRRVPREVAEELRRAADEAGVRGLMFFETWTRGYPQGICGLDILGVVGVDGVGLEGLEYRFDSLLRGKDPVRLRLVRGRDGTVFEYWEESPGTPGQDLHLTLDARIQAICAEKLDEGVERFRAKRGFAVVMDPWTGEILALAQSPRFDPKNPDPALLHPWAITDPFEPGSTFKALVGVAALDLGLVEPDEVFNGNSPIIVDGVPIRNAMNHQFGPSTFTRGITQSINTVLVQVALRLGVERLWEYLRRFGIGEPTGVELPGESSGTLRPPEEWTRVDLATASFGQGVSVNGLQLARAFCAIAADGLLPRPHILKGGGREKRRVASAEACMTMRGMLRQAVELPGATGRYAEVPGFEVAGKSGTAQKALPEGGYSQTKVMGAMAAFFPWKHPEYLVLVVYDEPSVWPNWGGSTAGPTVRWIIEEMYHQGLISPYVPAAD
mgnify:CR=1 FL=1